MVIVNRKHVVLLSSQVFSRHNVFHVLPSNQLLLIENGQQGLDKMALIYSKVTTQVIQTIVV